MPKGKRKQPLPTTSPVTIRSAGSLSLPLHIPCDDGQVSYIQTFDGTYLSRYTCTPLPVASPENKYKLPIISDGTGFLIAGLRQSVLVVEHYTKSGTQFTLDSIQLTAPSTDNPRVSAMKRLQSGAILLTWYKQMFDTALAYPRFCYRRLDGTWITVETQWDALGGPPWLSADFAQDSTGNIWYFAQHDSNHNLTCIHLTDTGEGVKIDWINNKYTPDEGILACEAENPYIICESYGEGIILAYQSSDYRIFSAFPWCKGAKINVTTVSPTGSHSLLYQTADYAERIIPFALLGSSIVYAPINPATLQYIELHYLKSDGTNINLGPTDWPQWFRNSQSYYAYNVAGKIKVSTL